MQGKFNFTGKLQCNKDDSKNPWLRTGKTSQGNKYQTFGAAVVSATNNRAYTESFAQMTDVIKNFDNDGNQIEIDFKDRLDDDIISAVRNKQIIRIGDTRKEFITPWDFIEFIKDNKEELDGKTVTVTGSINKNVYNGTVSDRFQIRNLYVVDEDTKPGLTITEEVYFTKDSVDTADWKTEKKLYLNGYVEAYYDGGNKMFPRQLVLDCGKLDFDNEKHIKLLQYKLKQFGLKYEDGKIVSTLKAKKVYKLIFVENYINGAEEVAFDESALTANQREAIELGLKKLEDFRPRGAIYGNRVTVYKIKDFDLTGDYADGFIESELSESDLDDLIYQVAKTEKAEDVLDKDDDVVEEDEDEDLFS